MVSFPFFKKQQTPIEVKYSAAGPLLATTGPGRARWTPADYGALAREGYAQNVVAYRCIREIASSVASVPILLYQGSAELSEHPLLDLLRQPNPSESLTCLLEGLVSQLLIAGNAYLEVVQGDAGNPLELWRLRPDRMKIVPGVHGVPAAYEYSTGTQKKRWQADPVTGRAAVLHIKQFHPHDDWYGMGPLEAASRAIDQYNEAESWNQSLLQHGCRPSGALSVEGAKGESATLTEDQYDRLRAQLEEQFSGSRNAGRPILLEGGLKWTDMMLSPKDMDFLNMKNTAAREIALAFGYPAMLLGIPGDNTYSNQKEARMALWEQTVLPLLKLVLDEVSGWLSPYFGEELRLGYDEDAISALHPRREILWSRIGAAGFLSDAEKREAVGYGADNS